MTERANMTAAQLRTPPQPTMTTEAAGTGETPSSRRKASFRASSSRTSSSAYSDGSGSGSGSGSVSVSGMGGDGDGEVCCMRASARPMLERDDVIRKVCTAGPPGARVIKREGNKEREQLQLQ